MHFVLLPVTIVGFLAAAVDAQVDNFAMTMLKFVAVEKFPVADISCAILVDKGAMAFLGNFWLSVLWLDWRRLLGIGCSLRLFHLI